MKNITTFLLVMVGLFSACNQNTISTQEAGLAIYQLSSNSDPLFLPFVSNLPEAKGFIPYYKLDPGMPPYVIGLAEAEEVKAPILKKLQKYGASFENLEFSWAKNSIKVPGKEGVFYPLFLLRTNNGQPALSLSSKDISSAEALLNAQDKNVISIQLNQASAVQWGELTSVVSNQANKYVASVIDGEVYGAPIVKGPIFTGSLLLSGFEDLEEAKIMAKRLLGKQ